jgi:hypothetical protein
MNKALLVENIQRRQEDRINIINLIMETIETLIEYCQENGKVVPKNWHMEFWDVLKNIDAKKGGAEAPMPFILAALSLPRWQKQQRLFEQLAWANDKGDIETVGKFLRNIEASNWLYFS